MLTLNMLDPHHAFETLCGIGIAAIALAAVIACLVVKP